MDDQIVFSLTLNHLFLFSQKNSQWIPENIFQRECIRYVAQPPRTNDDPKDPLCYCGNRKSSHDESYIRDEIRTTKWNWSDTKTTQTTAYGEVEFVGAIGNSATLNRKKYVRLDHRTYPGKVLELLRDHWKLGVPKLLISVTGGALNFHMNSRLRELFRNGLIKAALSTGAWIISGGINSGIMRYVGDALPQDYALASGTMSRNNFVAIGIASWGVIHQKENLTKDKNNPYGPANYRMDVSGSVKLDPNHTHFLLVDNGTSGKFGTEIRLRAEIENVIAKQGIGDDKDEDLFVPTVCIAVEGGPNTIFTVYEAVKKGTPAVIVAGSGRAANILAFAAQGAREVEVLDNIGSKEKKVVIDDNLRAKLAQLIKKEFGEKNVELHLNRIQECVEKTDLLNVYDMDSSTGLKDIDEAILHALMKANKGSKQNKLKLTLVWNRIDIAKSVLFSDDKEYKKGELDSALHYSLVHNQVDFVKLFLEHGVSLKDFLTLRELTLLYNEVKEGTLIYKYLDRQRERDKSTRKFNLCDVGKVIKEMMMDSYEPLYLQDLVRYLWVEGEIDFVTGDVVENESEAGAFESMEQHDLPVGIAQTTNCEHLNKFDNPVRELLIWSVLQGREEMSQFFWEQCKEMIAAALTSCMILRNMSEKHYDDDHKEDLSRLSDVFEDNAIGVLNECYNDDKEKMSINLIRELHQWGRATCFRLAIEGKMKKFLNHEGIQYLLTDIWMGKLSTENSNLILVLCVACPPLIYFLIKFREVEHLPDRSSSKLKKFIKANESPEMVKPAKPTGGTNRKQEYYHPTHDVDIRDSGEELSWYQRIKFFYGSPKIIFTHNLISYLVFLGLFSYIMLTSFNKKVSVAEYVLLFWIITLYTEEVRQIAQHESYSWRLRLLFWITDYWNIVDLATLILFTIGFTMRFFKETFAASRVVLAIDLMIFYIRLLHVFYVNQNLGPKLIMISKMVVDLAFFMYILFVFLVAYGVASQAIMFPNTDGFIPVIKGVFFQSYFQMYGELFLENIEGESGSCTPITEGSVGDIDDPCPEFSWVAICLLAGYMLLSNVLLLNLLIAMFSYTFSVVQDNSDYYWKKQRLKIVSEYFSRPLLAPPLIAVAHMYIFVTYILRTFLWTCIGIGGSNRFLLIKQKVMYAQKKHLVMWESFNGEKYMFGKRQKHQQDISQRFTSLLEKVDEINLKVDWEKINRLEDQIKRINVTLDVMTKTLMENEVGSKSEAQKLKEVIKYKEDDDEDDVTANEKDVYKVPITLEEFEIMIHTKARQSPYPGTAIRRAYVPVAQVPWKVDFPSYVPREYTHQSILDMPHWADIDLMAMSKDKRPMLQFNNEDVNCKVDRRSHVQHYVVKDGLPLNPRGRTGMVGRGLLGRFGPNHAAYPISTRWKMKANGLPMMDGGKKVLEFIAIQHKDNQQWAIPEGMVEPGEVISETFRCGFPEEALDQMTKCSEEKGEMAENIDRLFSNGIEIYRGYVDDPRNTDNAWIETYAMNFHDESGSAFGQLKLEAGGDARSMRWQRVSSRIPLFASHTAVLRRVAEKHNAAF
ncbi:transient receptor potential cation channel subfamily M member-like 2 isoform X2 [Anneissia japonica]|uniref:transient receptor potential cation channel subfamily M member-like 2 isoform X2 n=1 Tax=Anneissia japonica TaxID=1529436 RepID=UPI00142561CE|nr:transient receptor potential cation channel subfamily M member-like 2 isoform X2 [Anneissia japonica]